MKKLKKEQMEKIVGGVPAKEYCGTVHMLYDNGVRGEGMDFALSLCNGLGYPY